MASLNVHQSKAGDHDRLGFHPDCPVCRQDRLFGVLSPDPVIARRLRVLLATGVLALSSTATATSVASEPDRQQEGVAVPEPGAPPPGEGNGAEGSGGDTALPFEVDPVPTAPQQTPPADGSDDAAPLEAEPVDDPDGRLLLAAPDSPDDVTPEDAPVPPSEVAPPVAPAPPIAPPVDPGAETDASQPAPPTANPEPPRRAKKRARKDGGRAKRESRRDATRRDATRRGATPSGHPPAGSPPAASAPAASAPPTGAAEPSEAMIVRASIPTDLGNRRFHIVRPGESLWSIAEQVLGRRASAASIALEVRRLWRLNRHRIGTGDPNLLGVGVRLRLR